MFELSTPRPEDSSAIEDLLDQCFGADRQSKASYGYRRDVPPVMGLSLVARDGCSIVGSIRYWPIRVGHARLPALLLGPLAIAPDRQGQGIGAALVRNTVDLAAWGRHRLVLLVGDPPYYARFGFQPAAPHGIFMPDEKGERLLCSALDPSVLGEAAGPVRPWVEGPGAATPAHRGGVRRGGVDEGSRAGRGRRAWIAFLLWRARPRRTGPAALGRTTP